MLGFRSRGMESSYGALLRDLEHIWTEIGETEAEQDRMLFELEQECIQVYKRKVDEASSARAQLKQVIAAKEAEVAALRVCLGEMTTLSQQAENRSLSLKDQLASVAPLLEELRLEKEERVKLFSEIKSQIHKISVEIAGHDRSGSSATVGSVDLDEFSLRKLNEYQAELQALGKEKSDRLHTVLGYVSEVHCLCGVLGADFSKTLNEVHPSLPKAEVAQSSNISNSTLDGLSQVILRLKAEKKSRAQKLREAMSALYELWNFMDSPDEERRRFGRVLVLVGTPQNDITDCGVLSQETLDQITAEVERLMKLKSVRMKELVFERRVELEEICQMTHMEPDTSTAPEKINILIDSGILDPSELMAKIEDQIVGAKEESACRKEILDRVGKWLAVCEEEKWLEDYNRDHNRYSAGRGAHLNLKRAERARNAITKIPATMESLMKRTTAWENERNRPFLYDGMRLITVFEEYLHMKQQKDEEDKRYRDMKKLQALADKGTPPGSKFSSMRCNSLGRKPNGFGQTNGSMTPGARQHSAGGATPEILTPRSCYGNENRYFKEAKKRPTTPMNFVALSKREVTPSLPSISSSEPGSPVL